MTSFRERDDLDWDYLRVSKALNPFVRWEEQGPGIFELVVLAGWPSKVATNRPDGAYATKDLFSQHPNRPGLFRWTGRLDDTLVLMNGEKANPIALEHAIREHPLIAEAVVFGSNKPQLGAFIIPKPNLDITNDQDLLQRILPCIGAANRSAPGYSQLAVEMVRVLPAGTKYPRTDKDTVIRAAFYNQFQKEIDEVYDELIAKNTDAAAMTAIEMKDFLRSSLLDGLRLPDPEVLTDDTDFFTLGLDSLQALRIHSKIMKNVNLGGKCLGQNVVFEYPTLNVLGRYLTGLRHGENQHVEAPEDRMRALVDKYSTFRPHVPGVSNDPPTVLLTGATGSLGAHVLAQLTRDGAVHKVYCLVRAQDLQAAQARVITSLVKRSVYHDLTGEQRAKIVALPADLSREDLGLEHTMLQAIKASATCAIHLAWAVNFNMGVESFEKHHISG
jgi:acyl carrier protein